MNGRDDKVYQEASALWRLVHGEPPPADADATLVLDLLLGGLPETPYERLASPDLRRGDITFPKYSSR